MIPVVLAQAGGTECELLREGFLGQPVNSITSLAFVVVGLALAVGRRGTRPGRVSFGLLVVATGIGSFVEHGPRPPAADLAHDVPLAALIAFVAADAAADLLGRPLRWRWWVLPPALLVPVILVAPEVSDGLQVALAVAAVALSFQRARVRPTWTRTLLLSMVVLGLGGVIGTFSRAGGPLCQPDSLFQGHAVWHVLAATAMWLLAPVVGQVSAPVPVPGRP